MMPLRRRGRTFVIFAIGGAAAGCYSYEPLTTPEPQPGTFVAVTLSDSASVALAGYLGVDAAVVRGRYAGRSEQGLRLDVSSIVTDRGDETGWKGEPVTLPAAAVKSISTRRLSKGRSALLAGVGLTGLVATSVAFKIIGGGAGSSISGAPPKR